MSIKSMKKYEKLLEKLEKMTKEVWCKAFEIRGYYEDIVALDDRYPMDVVNECLWVAMVLIERRNPSDDWMACKVRSIEGKLVNLWEEEAQSIISRLKSAVESMEERLQKLKEVNK